MQTMNQTFRGAKVGRVAALLLFILSIAYVAVLVIGLATLPSPDQPIQDPYFTLMELLILITAPLYILIMAEIHMQAAPEAKSISLAALSCMIAMACITCIVHFLVLTVSRPLEAVPGLEWMTYLFSFTWPSVIYSLDILAWDFFFALAVLFAVPVFKGGRLENWIRILLIVSGVLSFVGLLGPVMSNMQIRNIGIIGYAGVFPVVCLLLLSYFGRASQEIK